MAKKDKDKKKDSQAGRSDAVRSAVDQAFQATAEQAESARVGAQAIVDEFAQAASRVRDVLEDLRPPSGDEVSDLRRTVATLEQRVAALEAAQAKPAVASRARKKPAAAKKPAATKPADTGGTGRS
jgi:ABC-type transporter Mla subunit MlaD